MSGTFKNGTKVTKQGYGYYGEVLRMERKFRTDWAVVLWEGSAFTVREYPAAIEPCPIRPERVVLYS